MNKKNFEVRNKQSLSLSLSLSLWLVIFLLNLNFENFIPGFLISLYG